MRRFVVTACLVGTALAGRAAGGAEAVNGIAALVGNAVITYEEVQATIRPAMEAFRTQLGAEPEALRERFLEVQRQGVERLVERQLILQSFDEAGFKIPETIIEENVEEEIKQRFGGDRATLNKTLQSRGITFESFQKEIRDQFVEYVMRGRNVPRDILISPGRIEKYYQENEAKYRLTDQVELRMIVLDKGRQAGRDVLALAHEIVAKLDEGVSFAEMAYVYSDGSQAREGGSWGWVERNVLREDLAEIAFKLPAGKRSQIIDKTEAIYLMQVEEKRVAHLRPLSEVREEIEKTLVTAERKRLEKQWIDRLRKKSFIRYF